MTPYSIDPPTLNERLSNGALLITPLIIVHDYMPIQVGESVISRETTDLLIRGLRYSVVFAAGAGEDRVLGLRQESYGGSTVQVLQRDVIRSDGLRRLL